MQIFQHGDTALNYTFRAGTGTPIVLLNSLGTDLRIWDGVIADLDPELPILCMDKRGHGLSDDANITMDILVHDVAALMDHLSLPPALICGVSVGGMIAQGLADARPNLVAGLILCCTGAKISDADSWNARIDMVNSVGLKFMADAILDRWFSDDFSTNRTSELAIYRNMLTRTPATGYAGVCAAIRDTDFNTLSFDVPTHCIAGEDDMATPPALVRALADHITGATFEIAAGCGHLPCIEAPELIAKAIRDMHSRI